MTRGIYLIAAINAAVFLTPFSASAAEGLKFMEKAHDFGVIESIEKLPYRFRFKNVSKKDISILSVTPSCGCTAAVPDKKKYGPKGEGSISVTFDPGGKSGKHEATVAVRTSEPAEYVLTLSADIKTLAPGDLKIVVPGPRISVSAKEIRLAPLKMGQAAIYNIIVENVGDADLLINNYNTPNDDGRPLNKNAIPPGKKVEITFYYTARQKGPINDWQEIATNDPVTPVTRIHLIGNVE